METEELNIFKFSDYESDVYNFTTGLTNKTGYAQIRDVDGVLIKNFTVTIAGNYLTLSLAKADVTGLTAGTTYYSDLKLKDSVTTKEKIIFKIKINVFNANTQIP